MCCVALWGSREGRQRECAVLRGGAKDLRFTIYDCHVAVSASSMLVSRVAIAIAAGRATAARAKPPGLLLRTVPPCASSSPLVRWLSTQSVRDPYAVLGLASDATPEQVKTAYYKLALTMHPDRNDSPDAADKFAEIGVAYNKIMGTPSIKQRNANHDINVVQQAAFAKAYPPWVYRCMDYLTRVPQRFDDWLMPSYSSIIYKHVKNNELAEALGVLEEMRLEGEQAHAPSLSNPSLSRLTLSFHARVFTPPWRRVPHSIPAPSCLRSHRMQSMRCSYEAARSPCAVCPSAKCPTTSPPTSSKRSWSYGATCRPWAVSRTT